MDLMESVSSGDAVKTVEVSQPSDSIGWASFSAFGRGAGLTGSGAIGARDNGGGVGFGDSLGVVSGLGSVSVDDVCTGTEAQPSRQKDRADTTSTLQSFAPCINILIQRWIITLVTSGKSERGSQA